MRATGTAAAAIFVIVLGGCSDQSTDELTRTVEMVPTERRATLHLDALPTPAPTTVPRLTLPDGFVSEATWPGEWPFTVAEGFLVCVQPQRVTFVSGQAIYALNGAAKAAGGYADVTSILKASSFPGVKSSVGPMIDRGLDFC